jgi:NADP-dependent 3-hydroxy acid dehydrogenase YdfG
MKIGITGHSRGIGCALFDLYSQDNEVVGFSRSNGFDISDPRIQNQIIKTCKDFDIFINNAWHPSGQAELLKKILEVWDKKKDKTIINIGSKASFWSHKTSHVYAHSKAEIQNIVNERMYEPYPRLINIILGMVDTEMAAEYKVKNKLSAEITANFIKDMVLQTSPVCVQQIMIAHPEEHFFLNSVYNKR